MQEYAGARPLQVGDCSVYVGTCSWSDRTLTQESGWYPKKTMKAAERLAYYSSRFPIVEVENTFRFPPTPDLSRQWAERTPPGFRMNIKAWALLTGFPALPNSLWPDLADDVKPELRDRRRLYDNHLPEPAMAECWKRFAHSIAPLHEAGRLGAVVLEYPRWFGPKEENRSRVLADRDHLNEFPVAVQFHRQAWVDAENCEATFEFLEEAGIIFAGSDGGGFADNPVTAATANIAMVRFFGRSDEWGYRYPDQELRDWLPVIEDLVGSTRELHLLMATCYRDAAVKNAEALLELLRLMAR